MKRLLVSLPVLLTLLVVAAPAQAAAPANDNFSAAQVITGAPPQTVTGTNVDATEEAGEPDHAGRDGKHSVWYRWVATITGRVAVGTCPASDFDSTVAVYTGATVNAPLTEVASNDDACGAYQSSAVFDAVQGTTYRIAVDGYSTSNVGAFTLKLQASTPLQGDSLIWGNYGGNAISYSNLDGNRSGQLDLGGATLTGPYGLALDPAKNKIWWVNYDANSISSANLTGGGGTALSTGAAPLNDVNGLALDPTAGILYWANYTNNTIGFARTDGSGGGTFATGAATVNKPCGLTVDPTRNRLYWVNYATGSDSSISYANLDGSGGGTNLTITGDKPDYACGVAVDDASDRVWWANIDGDVGSASTAGGAGTYLDSTNFSGNPWYGLALDPPAGKVWFADYSDDQVLTADMVGGGAAQLDTGTAVVDQPAFPSILRKPSGTGAPVVTANGSELACSKGSWAADLVASFLYRAPQNFTYAWTRDGQPVSGAIGATLTASQSGSYACTVTAGNAAGTAAQSSAAIPVSAASNDFKVGKAKVNKKKGTATLPITVPGPGQLSLAGKTVKKAKATAKKKGSVDLLVKPAGKAKKKLKAKGKVKLKVQVTFAPDGGAAKTTTAKVKLKLAG